MIGNGNYLQNGSVIVDLGTVPKGIDYGYGIIKTALDRRGIKYSITPDQNGIVTIKPERPYTSAKVLRVVKDALLEAINSNNGKHEKEKSLALRSSLQTTSFYNRGDYETHTLPVPKNQTA